MSRSTSFRISDAAREQLVSTAKREGASATALLERLILEGIDSLQFPGIVHRGPGNDRRAALAAGPDVWEVVARLRQLRGSEERRIAILAKETDLHPRLIRLALEYAARHSDDVTKRIELNEEAIRSSRRAARRRTELLA